MDKKKRPPRDFDTPILFTYGIVRDFEKLKISLNEYLCRKENDWGWVMWSALEINDDRPKPVDNGLELLLSEKVLEMVKDKSELRVWGIFDYWTCSTVTQTLSSGQVQQMCQILLSDDRRSAMCWSGHRVLCLAVKWLIKKFEDKEWTEEMHQCLMEYFVKLIEQYEDMETVKWIVLTVEKWALKGKLSCEAKSRLVNALQLHATYLEQVDIFNNEYDQLRCQVSLCAQWCSDKVLPSDGQSDIQHDQHYSLIKLSRDGLVARNDNSSCSVPVRASFAVPSDSCCYYEVICLPNYEKMRVGWSTQEAELSDATKIGDNELSIGLEIDGCCHIYHKQNVQQIRNAAPQLESDNVIGCLIDVPGQQFVFYLNGEIIEYTDKIYFSSTSPYYATVNLPVDQQCHFNFGQTPFRHQPKRIQVLEQINNAKLAKTIRARWFDHFCFKEISFTNESS